MQEQQGRAIVKCDDLGLTQAELAELRVAIAIHQLEMIVAPGASTTPDGIPREDAFRRYKDICSLQEKLFGT